MNLKHLFVAAAIAITPVMSFASTVPVPSPAINGLALSPYDFDQSFASGSLGQTIDFIFENDTGISQVFSVAAGTINQQAAHFTGGVSLTWLGSGQTDSVAGVNGTTLGIGPITSLVLSAGATDTLRLTFGAVVDTPGDIGVGSGNIDFTVTTTPVPVPAGLLLMGTALAGFGVMRRKSKKAA